MAATLSEVQWRAKGDQGPPVPVRQDPDSEATEQEAGAGLPHGQVGRTPGVKKAKSQLPGRRGGWFSGRALANQWQMMKNADR